MGYRYIITKIEKMKELVEECIPVFSTEEKGREFAKDPDIEIHKKAAKELGDDHPVDKPGLIVKQAV